MKTKVNKNSSEILNKKFNTKINGYDPIEVDEYLDIILADYLYYESESQNNSNNLNFNKNMIDDLKQEILILKIENKNLINQVKNLPSSLVGNKEMLKRIAKLESENLKK